MASNAYFYYNGNNQVGIVENKGHLVVNTTHDDGVRIITSFNNFGTFEIETGLLRMYRYECFIIYESRGWVEGV